MSDLKKNEWVAARDPFGIKPLYFYKTDRYLYFASEIKCFLDIPGFQTKRNDKANDVLSKIMQKLPLDLKERTPPQIKGKLSVVLLNAEQFFNTTENVSLSEQYKRMRNQLLYLIILFNTH